MNVGALQSKEFGGGVGEGGEQVHPPPPSELLVGN